MAKDAVAARDFARRVTDAARAEADAIVSRARAEAARLERDAADEARARGGAALGGVPLATGGGRAARRAGSRRIVQLATVLAERLLGEAIERDPARVVALARQALLEARGARRVLIEACPLDVETLTRHVEGIGSPTARSSFDPIRPSRAARSASIRTSEAWMPSSPPARATRRSPPRRPHLSPRRSRRPLRSATARRRLPPSRGEGTRGSSSPPSSACS